MDVTVLEVDVIALREWLVRNDSRDTLRISFHVPENRVALSLLNKLGMAVVETTGMRKTEKRAKGPPRCGRARHHVVKGVVRERPCPTDR